MTLDVTLKLATLSETVTVTGETPLIETTQLRRRRRRRGGPHRDRAAQRPAVRQPGRHDPRRRRSGFHSDPTKSTQFSPQINGGNGRNVNYQIDGGDNNDDTVGGLLQLFPLEAIQEFNFVTSRYKAEYGRSQGGVMNIVTKSGTNDLRGSWFTLFRDDAMNAKTADREADTRSDKQDYRRYQYGGSFGGPIVQDKIHYFARLRADAAGHVPGGRHPGAVPELDGVFATPYRETLVTDEGDDEPEPEALPVGALRPEPELAAVRREPAAPPRTAGATARTRSTRST